MINNKIKNVNLLIVDYMFWDIFIQCLKKKIWQTKIDNI